MRTRERFCPEHKKADGKRVYQGRKARGGFSYATARWKRFRKLALSKDPICHAEVPHHGTCLRPAVHVHHLKPLAEGGATFSLDNVGTLCRSCHSRATVLERGGVNKPSVR